MATPLEVRRDNGQDTGQNLNGLSRNGSFSATSDEAQTASEFISSQLQLEADAREALPYTFDHCTNPLGPLKQNVFSCLTCNPPPQSPSDTYNPAGICYSCSIQCHGEHTLVELFGRRNFTCDCGTTRLPKTSPCTLRINPDTGVKGLVHSQAPAESNTYNRNFYNRFCGCGEIYNAHEQKGTMFQCYGLATEEDGGCGEDWWHPECVLGLERGKGESRVSEQTSDAPLVNASSAPPGDNDDDEETAESGPPLPPGFPAEEDFENFICYKCIGVNPWLKAYAGTKGFLDPVFKAAHTAPVGQENASDSVYGGHHEKICRVQAPLSADEIPADQTSRASLGVDESNVFVSGLTESSISDRSCFATSMKRKAECETPEIADSSDSKKQKVNEGPRARHLSLPSAPKEAFSLFLREDFRDHLCRCAECYPILRAHPQLLEEEVLYEPPLSQDGEGDGESMGTGSLLDRGEAALSNVDRVRAIEGVMVYNHLKDKVKSFLQPFAESGQPVAAEDIKAYFEKLRGDDMAIKAAGGRLTTAGGDEPSEGGNRSEQSGY